MGRAQNTVKRDSFWRGEWSAAGAAAPLSYEEERNAVLLCLRATAGQGPNYVDLLLLVVVVVAVVVVVVAVVVVGC